MNKIIQQELEKEFKLIDKGIENKQDYDFEKMPLNPLIIKREWGYEFPVELSDFILKRSLKVIKLPFKIVLSIGREIKEVIK